MVDGEGASHQSRRHSLSPPDPAQHNRDPPAATADTPQWDTDKVVALMLRSHTVVLADSVEAPGSVAWKKACPVSVEQEWRVGLCANPP